GLIVAVMREPELIPRHQEFPEYVVARIARRRFRTADRTNGYAPILITDAEPTANHFAMALPLVGTGVETVIDVQRQDARAFVDDRDYCMQQHGRIHSTAEGDHHTAGR